MSQQTRILSLDGGPAGPSMVRCIEKICALQPDFLQSTDLIAGVSEGALAAAFYARWLGQGDDASVAADCVRYTNGMLRIIAPTLEDWKAFLPGTRSLKTTEAMEAYLRLPENLGTTRLGDLPQRVVFLAGRNQAPWRPAVYANCGSEATPDEDLVDLVLRSSAFPMLMPVRAGQVDGAMCINNPGTLGLAVGAPRDAHGNAMLGDVAMLEMGADDGSSLLSPLFTPDTPMPQSRDHSHYADVLMQVDDARIAAMHQRMVDFLEQAHDEAPSKLGIHLRRPSADVPLDVSEDWGWIKWMLHLPAPLWAMSIYLNSQGRGLHAAHNLLLGGRNLRVAPVGVVPTNVLFLALLLGQIDLVEAAADLTADLWAEPISSRACEFVPTVGTTAAWLQRYWAPPTSG